MKIVQADKSKAVLAIVNALKDNHEIINLADVNSFNYEHFWHIKTCDFILNNGTFGSEHPKRQWSPDTVKSVNHKMAVMNYKNDLINMFAQHFNKKIIMLESSTLSRIKCNYIDKYYKLIAPKFYRMGLNHWVFSKTKWCKPIEGRLKKNIDLIEAENSFTFKNVYKHQWKNNKDGYILILPGLEDDPTSSIPVDKFVEQSVKQIQNQTNRKIIVKAHPHSKLTFENLGIEVIKGPIKIADLAKNVYCAVLDSSTSIFELIELGIPTIATVNSFGMILGNTEFSKIENLYYATSDEVLKWYEQMAATEFLLSEFYNKDFILPRIMELLNE
jgi:hypothetical protein